MAKSSIELEMLADLLKGFEDQRRADMEEHRKQREADMKSQREQLELIVQKLTGTVSPALTSHGDTELNNSFSRKRQKEFALIAERISVFDYDPESSMDFKVWINRHSHILEKDGEDLEDSIKVKLVLEKLTSRVFEIYRKFKLPQSVYEISFEETKQNLTALFSSNVTKTASRMICLNMAHRESESIAEYTGRISELFEQADFSEMSSESWKCLIWIFGLKDKRQVMLKHHLLNILERMESKKEQCTVQLLHAEYEKFEKQKLEKELFVSEAEKAEANQTLISQSNECNSVRYRKSVKDKTVKDKKSFIKASDSRESAKSYKSEVKNVCFNCDKFGHLSRQCRLKKSHCAKCNREGHLAKFCQMRAELIKRKLEKENELNSFAQINAVTVKSNSALSDSRPSMTVKVNGVNVVFRVDTGSDLTLINKIDWLRIGAPVLSKTTKCIKNASEDQIKLFGKVSVNVETSYSSGKRLAYVGTTENVFGLDWIRQCDHMRYHLEQMGSSARKESKSVDKVKVKVGKVVKSDNSRSMLTVENNGVDSKFEKNKHRRIPKRFFREGDGVYIRILQNSKEKWTTGVVKSKLGHGRYMIHLNDEKVVKRHENELKSIRSTDRRLYPDRRTVQKPVNRIGNRPAEDPPAELSLSKAQPSCSKASWPSHRRHLVLGLVTSSTNRRHYKEKEVLCRNKEYEFYVNGIGTLE